MMTQAPFQASRRVFPGASEDTCRAAGSTHTKTVSDPLTPRHFILFEFPNNWFSCIPLRIFYIQPLTPPPAFAVNWLVDWLSTRQAEYLKWITVTITCTSVSVCQIPDVKFPNFKSGRLFLLVILGFHSSSPSSLRLLFCPFLFLRTFRKSTAPQSVPKVTVIYLLRSGALTFPFLLDLIQIFDH